MTGWNMPPGCNERDIPGNSREDEAEEALANSVANVLVEYGIDPDSKCAEALYDFVSKLRSDAYAEGYAQGGSDEREAQDYKARSAYNATSFETLHLDDK
jgi:hypothetical protein